MAIGLYERYAGGDFGGLDASKSVSGAELMDTRMAGLHMAAPWVSTSP